MPVPTQFSGGCACGAIRFTCSASPIAMVNCHCRACQKATGSAFAPVVIVSSEAFNITRGDPACYESRAESGNTASRYFCRECGARVYARSSGGGDYIGIMVGSLDDPSWFEPVADFWMENAQPWDVMRPHTAKFPKGPPLPGQRNQPA